MSNVKLVFLKTLGGITLESLVFISLATLVSSGQVYSKINYSSYADQSCKTVPIDLAIAQNRVATIRVSNIQYGLGDLIVLDRLFNQKTLQANTAADLGDLLILDRLFNGRNSFLNTDLPAVQSTNKYQLSDLVVLDKLFRNNSNFLHQDKLELGDLFILNQLFNGPTGGGLLAGLTSQ